LHGHVQVAEAFDRELDSTLDILSPADVAHHRFDATAAAADRIRGGVEGVPLDIEQYDARAFGGEPLGDRAPEPLR
jgi:hypothetical protein